MRKDVFEHAVYAYIRIHPTHARSHQGICFPLIHSMVFNDSVSGQQRP